jgi:hypothetical protein
MSQYFAVGIDNDGCGHAFLNTDAFGQAGTDVGQHHQGLLFVAQEERCGHGHDRGFQIGYQGRHIDDNGFTASGSFQRFGSGGQDTAEYRLFIEYPIGSEPVTIGKLKIRFQARPRRLASGNWRRNHPPDRLAHLRRSRFGREGSPNRRFAPALFRPAGPRFGKGKCWYPPTRF